ncbi:hypothetical protein H4R18_001636 [Coemansia javaensis]|uniref:Pre-mRNA-splicing factor n=1 Tax=Coemansia javaensis TaxID=2761396 RepID=A0A9W8LL42_9FUNG|nr:hypothetical protein H4R18_001636 [Coemansia javaensis]
MPPRARARGRGAASGRGRRRAPARAAVSKDKGKEEEDKGEEKRTATADAAEPAALWAEEWSVDAVRRVLAERIVGSGYARASVQALERAQYLERYLWPHFGGAGAEDAVVVSVLLMVNEKLQQRLPAWAVVASDAARFAQLFGAASALMARAMDGAAVDGVDPISARVIVTQFLVGCFGSLETAAVREAAMPLASLAIWHHVGAGALVERELQRVPQLRKLWRRTARRCQAPSAERDFVPALVRDLARCQFALADSAGARAYAAKALELLLDLMAQLPTRRYVALLLEDAHLVALCRRSAWFRDCRRFRDLVGRLRASVRAQVAHVTGRPLSDADARDAHHRALAALQLAAFRLFPRALEDVAVSSVARLGDPDVLRASLGALGRDDLRRLGAEVGVGHRALLDVGAADFVEPDGSGYGRDFLLDAFAERYARWPTVAEQVRAVSPYPTEQLLLGDALADADALERQPQSVADADGAVHISYPVLGAPKLGLQFLTLHDYLARSFELLRLETAHGIRDDVEDAVRRLQPRPAENDGSGVCFAGWARMALPMRSFDVTDVQPPSIGDKAPARVRADVCVDLRDYAEAVRRAWLDEVRPRDVLILCAVQAPPSDSGGQQQQQQQQQQALQCVRHVRGCEVECLLDEDGRPLDGGGNSAGSVIRLRVALDRHQYHADSQAAGGGGGGGDGTAAAAVYGALNVVVRRRAQESNFKAVLETVRDLMVAPAVLPEWLAATFLGYGDPAAAAALPAEPAPPPPGRVWFGDTFVSEAHLRASLAPRRVELGPGGFAPPCVAEFPADADDAPVRVTSEPPPSLGPAELAPPRANRIEFTPAQVRAIHSAARPGLTLIVGPPGSGKTDVAVQIVANLYRAHPRQTILLVTHSNQALNQLFEKIIALDIEPRHLLRLGHGEDALDADESYSRAGRVDSFLARREALLHDVRALARSIDVDVDVDTCENARFFFIVHVRMRWLAFRKAVLDGDAAAEGPDPAAVRARFPFARFFAERLGRPLFADDDSDSDPAATAEGCFRWLERVFDELAEIQPFELLRSSAERANYLLASQARIVAMTCTHAALRRADLLRLGFRYDTVVMEEAAQVLDVETLIPLTLQRTRADAGRALKRVVLIGDHNQLPPVVRSSGLRAAAVNMEQSLFARLVRLGVPYIELNRQARARPGIADLYRFRYRELGDLAPHVHTGPFAGPNPGLAHEFQFVHVGEFRGRGETEPSRHFVQNLGEAEYVVAVFQYLRLLGCPGERIALLTTYNGQKALIQDVLDRRCGWLPYFGRPMAVATVDQFQGQQCDFVLLSLVRTRAVGHVRDLRRLTVALSRARLGLYVFGCRQLFEHCFELREPLARLLANGDRLALCPDERFDGETTTMTSCCLPAGPSSSRNVRLVSGVEEMGDIVYAKIEAHLASAEPDAKSLSGKEQPDDEAVLGDEAVSGDEAASGDEAVSDDAAQ